MDWVKTFTLFKSSIQIFIFNKSKMLIPKKKLFNLFSDL